MAEEQEPEVDSSFAEMAEKLDDAISDVGDGVRSVLIDKPADFIEGMFPNTSGTTPEEAAEAYEKPEPSKFDQFLEKLTGTNTGEFSLGKLGNHLTSKLGALKDLIVGTLLSCLRKLLMKLMNKYPALALLLNLEQAFGEFIGKYKRLVEDKIDEITKDILYRTLQVQQLDELNKKLNKMIRSICEKASPKSTMDMNNDFSLAKYVAETSAEELAAAVSDEVLDQSAGYPARGPEMYINNDGTPKTTSQRLADAQDTLNNIGDKDIKRLDDMTIEEAVAVKALIEEIAVLKQRDVDEQNLAEVTC